MWPIIQVCFHGSEKPNCSIKYRLLYKVLNELANFKSKQAGYGPFQPDKSNTKDLEGISSL